MRKLYNIYDPITFKYVSTLYTEIEPENSTLVSPTIDTNIAIWDGVNWVENLPENYNDLVLALYHEYPHLQGQEYKLINLDNLEGIEREVPMSDRGLKGTKKYYKGEQLIWSSEKKYWFEDETIDGFVRIIKLYSLSGLVLDTWKVKCKLSEDDKQLFNKRRRELIFEYLKGRQPELFNLVYGFFTEEVNNYVMIGGSELANTLIDAKDNHPYSYVDGEGNTIYPVRQTLSLIVQTPTGQSVTVLQGVLAELI